MDFDGTIADIAPTPDEARVRPGCANALRSLSRKLAAVSVISGRSAEELQSKVGLEGVTYAGNHGAELIEDGRLTPGAESGGLPGRAFTPSSNTCGPTPTARG